METALVIFNVGTALAACRGDPALVRALINQYQAGLPTEGAALAQACTVTPPDWETAQKQVHRLQSGSAYLGAERIAAAAQDLERSLRARDSADALAQAQRTLDKAFQGFLDARISV